MVVQVYVDDIFFVTKDTKRWEEFTHLMCKDIEMSMMGELNFIGVKIKQTKERIFLNQSKYELQLIKSLD